MHICNPSVPTEMRDSPQKLTGQLARHLWSETKDSVTNKVEGKGRPLR